VVFVYASTGSTSLSFSVFAMAPIAAGSQFDRAALARRQQLAGGTGPAALVKNFRVFSIACFACLGGLLYGYNQGVFSGVLTMPAFNHRKSGLLSNTNTKLTFASDMGVYTSNQTKKGWLTSILELGAWFGTMYT